MSIEMREKARPSMCARLPAQWPLVPVLVLATFGCQQPKTSSGAGTPTVSIDFSKRSKPPEEPGTPVAQQVLNVAAAGMTSPPQTLRYYQKLLEHVEQRIGLPVRMVQRKTYQEVNGLLATGELDAAFLCSGGYVAGGDTLASEILAVPVIRGKTTYQAYIIANADSDIRDFLGLRRHSFAFTDPLSNTGWLYPVSKLEELGTTPSIFFSQVTYTYGHDRSIEAVAFRITDGASIDSLVYEHYAETAPDKVRGIRVIERSPEFGIPPVVASPKMERGLKGKLKTVLLNMHQDAQGRRILEKLLIDRFVPGDQRAYDPIRRMAEKVGPWRP